MFKIPEEIENGLIEAKKALDKLYSEKQSIINKHNNEEISFLTTRGELKLIKGFIEDYYIKGRISYSKEIIEILKKIDYINKL
tara:strand:- start:30 stop:278 length:249 start_codon:yes stop_codon:yes gene_type:complete